MEVRYKMKRLFISITILALLFVPQFALGTDLDDLKATYEKVIQAWNNFDADTIASMDYPGRVNYFCLYAFPDVAPMENTQEHIAKSLKKFFDNIESFSVTPYNIQYRVIDNTGIVWGYFTMIEKQKGELTKTWYVRTTSTWMKSNGKWYSIMTHNSRIPPSD